MKSGVWGDLVFPGLAKNKLWAKKCCFLFFISSSHAAWMKSSEAFSHNTLVPCFPFNKASSGRMWHNWFLGFRDLEMAGTRDRRGNSPAELWFKYSNMMAESCYYCIVILPFSCKKMLSTWLCCRTGTFESRHWHRILTLSPFLALHNLSGVLP